MNRFISPILNLKVSGDTSPFNIYDPNKIGQHFVTDNFLALVGSIEIGRIFKNPVWFIEVENTSNLGGKLHLLNNYQNNILSTGFWLLKDCSCTSQVAFLFNETDVQKDIRNIFNSNASGRYEPIEFTLSELEEAFNLYRKLHEIIGTRELEPPEVQTGTIRSPLNDVPYNDFENIERALNFIQLARSTSRAPEKVSWYIVAIEALFGNNEPGEIIHKVSYRTALFFDLPIDQKLDVNDKVKLAYGLRSKFLHGAKLENKHKTEEVQIEISKFLDDLLRQVFNIIIQDDEKRKLFVDKTKFEEFFKQKMFGN